VLVRRWSATLLLGLTFNGFGSPWTLQHVDAQGLRATGRELRIDAPRGLMWTRHDDAVALVVFSPRGSAHGATLEIVDAGRLRVRRTIAVARREVCAVAFDGASLVVLAARPWCYGSGGSAFSLLRVAPGRSRVSSVTPVAGRWQLVWPASIAFGGGDFYVARAGGEIDSIDARSGVRRTHRPRRALAKAGDTSVAHWLGGHVLSVGGTVIDVRTWRSRVLRAGARGIVRDGLGERVAFGSDGLWLFAADGRLRRHAIPGEDVSDVGAAGRFLYATVGSATDVVDARTGRQVRVVPDPGLSWRLVAD
jgi:hypothetical protein